MKLGAASESWLRHEGRLVECTADTWRYVGCDEERISAVTADIVSSTAVSLRRRAPLRPLATSTPVADMFLDAAAARGQQTREDEEATMRQGDV